MCSVGDPIFWKSSGRLADGREIIYFDESPGLGRASVPDRRPLARTPGGSGPGQADQAGHPGHPGHPGLPGRDLPPAGLRWDALAGEWVIVAAQRQDRTFLPPPGECPLYPSLRGLPPADRPPADRPPADRPLDAVPFLPGGPPETGGVPGRPPIGRCEVVCFTADHNASFASLPPQRVRTVLEAWADRTTVLSATPGIEQVYCFENRGEEIGVTLHH